MKWNYAGAGGGTIFHVSICVPGSLLHVAPGTAMPSEAGLHASRARELGVQIPERGGGAAGPAQDGGNARSNMQMRLILYISMREPEQRCAGNDNAFAWLCLGTLLSRHTCGLVPPIH